MAPIEEQKYTFFLLSTHQLISTDADEGRWMDVELACERHRAPLISNPFSESREKRDREWTHIGLTFSTDYL
jgi:hypothetical protein